MYNSQGKYIKRISQTGHRSAKIAIVCPVFCLLNGERYRYSEKFNILFTEMTCTYCLFVGMLNVHDESGERYEKNSKEVVIIDIFVRL